MKLCVVAWVLAACGESGLDQARNVALIASDRTANGVYVGEGLFVTNWHVCLRYELDDTLGPDDYVLAYNDPGDGAPYDEGASIDGYYCLTADQHWVYAAEAPAGEVCLTISSLPRQRLRFSDDPRREDGLEASAIVFAQKGLDLCIVELSADIRTRLASRPALAIRIAPVRLGQSVVLAGFASGAPELSAEECKVIRETAAVRDPDQIQPSDLEVPSFEIDCAELGPGSSGSAVLDASSGALLGLLWTGTTDPQGYRSGYVTAASAWLAAQDGRPAAQYSRLAKLLEDFGEN
jgi:hypothetical protein